VTFALLARASGDGVHFTPQRGGGQVAGAGAIWTLNFGAVSIPLECSGIRKQLVLEARTA